MSEVASGSGVVRGVLRTMRMQHWVKNGLLFAALVFAQDLGDMRKVLLVCAAFAAWCLTASGIYFLNDLQDLEEDRQHPEKALRPIAHGDVPVPVARAAMLLLLGAGLGVGFLLDVGFGACLTAYAVLNVAYSLKLKHIVILDVMTLAAGFVLRAVGGGIVIHVEVSAWLIICTTLLALFLGFGKRRHELTLLEDRAADHRPILNEYSPYFLDQMMSVVTASTVVTYCLYTLDPITQEKLGPYLWVTVPFVLYGIFRYLYLVHQKGGGGNPTRTLLTDRPLVATIGLWLMSAVLILYVFPSG